MMSWTGFGEHNSLMFLTNFGWKHINYKKEETKFNKKIKKNKNRKIKK